MAMAVGMIMLSFDTSSLMIIHLGVNPVSGGSPPRDIRTIRAIEVKRGNLFHVFDSIRVVVFLLRWNSRNMLIVRVI